MDARAEALGEVFWFMGLEQVRVSYLDLLNWGAAVLRPYNVSLGAG